MTTTTNKMNGVLQSARVRCSGVCSQYPSTTCRRSRSVNICMANNADAVRRGFNTRVHRVKFSPSATCNRISLRASASISCQDVRLHRVANHNTGGGVTYVGHTQQDEGMIHRVCIFLFLGMRKGKYVFDGSLRSGRCAARGSRSTGITNPPSKRQACWCAKTKTLYIVLNGICCYQQNHSPNTECVDIPIGSNIGNSDMMRSLPGCRGGSLVVCAVDTNRCVLDRFEMNNFCWTQSGGTTRRASTSTLDPERVVASTLRKAGETHRWELPVTMAADMQVLELRLAFERDAVTPRRHDVHACVQWTLRLSESVNTLSGTGIVGEDADSVVFNPVIPPGMQGMVQCEISASGQLDTELRYIQDMRMHRHASCF